jgi:hypothetical protein
MIRLCAECHAVRERDFSLLAERADDLSTDGMLVRSDLPVTVGEDVLVALRLPPHGSWIDAEARVLKVDEEPNDRGRVLVQLGFERIDRVSRLMLCEVLLDRLIDALE